MYKKKSSVVLLPHFFNSKMSQQSRIGWAILYFYFYLLKPIFILYLFIYFLVTDCTCPLFLNVSVKAPWPTQQNK